VNPAGTNSIRVMAVFGTRPEGIKMMPVVRALRAHPAISPIVCTTGQHRQMLDQVFSVFGEGFDHDLDIMEPNQTLGDITARVLDRLGRLLAETKPDLVLVHGDTTTAMAAAMAAFYARIPIGHVEAGLRSFDLARPWPEEFNRVAIDAIADLMFAPTPTAAGNLSREYNQRGKVLVTGNSGIDALLYVAGRLETEPALSASVAARYPFLDPERRLVLVTGHRRESFGEGFARICDGLATLAARGDVQVVYPVHLNPQVQGVVRARLSGLPNIHLIEPVEYLDMIYLMRQSTVLVTDSGGIQEEGPALGKPVLVMRDVTERPEAIAAGSVRLVGTQSAAIIDAVTQLLDSATARAAFADRINPYGDGHASERIVAALTGRPFEEFSPEPACAVPG
jgi:UDP-N-acetylglucosamine 2-epimerase (non-hydrolysing)